MHFLHLSGMHGHTDVYYAIICEKYRLSIYIVSLEGELPRKFFLSTQNSKLVKIIGAFERKSPQGFSNYYPFFLAFKVRQG